MGKELEVLKELIENRWDNKSERESL
jgi:hypothetical protein